MVIAMYSDLIVRARDKATGTLIKEKRAKSEYQAECFAADFHIGDETRDANIFIGETLIYGTVS